MDDRSTDRVCTFLLDRGAGLVPHLRGFLFDHLRRTEALLRHWSSPEPVAVAGLCHATYGTDGFAPGLLGLDERQDLIDLVGETTEALVYLYACCDRSFVYPTLAAGCEPWFRDRFTGTEFRPDEVTLRRFVDITLANETDVGLVGGSATEPPAWLRSMVEGMGARASGPVRTGVHRLMTPTAP